MKLHEIFDIQNDDHIAAIRQVNTQGSFPEGFLDGVDYCPKDIEKCNTKLMEAGIGIYKSLEPEQVQEVLPFEVDETTEKDSADVVLFVD